MEIESELYTRLNAIVGARAYPDTAPDNAAYPLILYQVIGGQAFEYLERKLPDREHARVQVMVWSPRRPDVSRLARAARKQIIESDLIAETYGAPTWLYDDDMDLRGSRQDFGIWYVPE